MPETENAMTENEQEKQEERIFVGRNDLFGRRKIFTSEEDINEGNVISALNLALAVHVRNIEEEDYLHWYRKGRQPILLRRKRIRPEICNKVVINNANMVVTFKNGYFLTKPGNYVSRSADEEIVKKVKALNEFLYASGKPHADNTTVDNFHTVGLGVTYLEPNERKRKPINVYALDPKQAFCVYSMRPGNPVKFAVNMVTTGNGLKFDVYTDTRIFHLIGGYAPVKVGSEEQMHPHGIATDIVSVEENRIGMIPFVEYQYNANRMSAFESAISIMDDINNMESNRADGVEQQIQQLCIAYNCQFEDGVTANSIREAGMIQLKSVGDNKADFKILTSELNQTDTQTTIDSLYEQMLEKCGVPSSVRDGGSTSDNVGAVYLRSGWASADTDARNTEDLFRESDERFLEIFLRILEQKNLLTGLEPEDVELVIERNRMDNLVAKTQSALNMKMLGLAPEIVLERSGLSTDPVKDIEVSKEWIFKSWDNSVNDTAKQPDRQWSNNGENPGDGNAVRSV